MPMRRLISRSSHYLRVGLTFLAALNYTLVGPLVSATQAGPVSVSTSTVVNKPADAALFLPTNTPIKHAIVIIGENRTFDHIFATYKPKPGQTVDNLLSKHIINPDGTPGPNYAFAVQYSASTTGLYDNSPQGKSLYSALPAPLVGGPSNICKNNGICNLADATSSENGLAPGYYYYMETGGTGQKNGTPDRRIPNVNNLPPGPFQLSSRTFPYDSYAQSPVHRFYQMWEQLDCNRDYAFFWSPAGCNADLFA